MTRILRRLFRRRRVYALSDNEATARYARLSQAYRVTAVIRAALQ